jgi:hypothetical protein
VNAFIEVGGPTLTIEIDGKKHYFEFHEALGVMATDVRGNGIKGTNKFWHAVSCWAQQGRKLENNVCVWKECELK